MRRLTAIILLAIAGFVSPAAAQSWTTPRTWSTGETVTATIMNTHVRDNLSVLRAGGFALASQAVGDLQCASSTTQFARLAGVATGQILASGGVGACPAYSSTLTVTGNGTHSFGAGGTGAANTSVRISASNNSTNGGYLSFARNGTDTGYVGHFNAIMGGGSTDVSMLSYAGSGIGWKWVVNAGASEAMALNTNNQLSLPSANLSGAAFSATGSGTSSRYIRFANTGGDIILGVEQSAGGNLATGSPAYSSYVGTNNATALVLGVNATVAWGINTAKDWTFGSSNHIADSSGTPSINSCGTGSPAVVGTDYAMKVTIGSVSGACIINFGHTWTSAPVCTVSINAANTVYYTSPTTTAVEIQSFSYATISNQTAYVLCRGY